MIFVLIVAQKAILKIHDTAFSPLNFISRGEITKYHCHRGAHTNQPDNNHIFSAPLASKSANNVNEERRTIANFEVGL
jgi:hypothetical protein